MPAILTHASIYPPHEWDLVSEPTLSSEDQLWNEMTKEYELRMATRHLQAFTTIKDTITKANLRMLRPETIEYLEKEACIKRKTSFEDEPDIDYVHLNMEQYDDDRERIFRNRMQTISEGQELQPEAHENSIRAGQSLKDIDKLAEFKQAFINDDVENSLRPPRNEII